MLENIDLSRKISKARYKASKDEAALEMGVLQRWAKKLGVPVIIVFEGWDAAGKGTLINNLILPLDPRGFNVQSALAPNEEEALRPFLWRFWIRTPARGRIAIFDRSWYRRVLAERVDHAVKTDQIAQSFEDIRFFERTLADDGAVIVKFFLHISKDEQKRRFAKLRKNPTTAWRVTAEDLRRQNEYADYLAATEDMLAETDSDDAPWTIIEAHDERFATMKIFSTVASAMSRGIAAAEDAQARQSKGSADAATKLPADLQASILDQVDLSPSLEREPYKRKLKKLQNRFRELEHEIYIRRVPVVIVYEGWDAAGKGGNIKRLVRELDPRGYEVVPIAAPNDAEKAHHYLWRFWTQMPKAGHITIFDRSWYGRVMVERVEGFCTETEWRRAYREINEMEQHMVNFGTALVKFWLHIDADEQLSRFEARQADPYKQWKITGDDWRNREKYDQYKVAIEEMLFRTSTPRAPWTIVESNSKLHARVKALDTVCDVIEAHLD